MEHLMRVQLAGIDKLKDLVHDKRHEIVKAQDLAKSLDKERLALQEYISLIEDPQKLQEELACSKAWAGALKKTLDLTLENRRVKAKEMEALKEEMESLKLKMQH